MSDGLIVRSLGGFYNVRSEDGSITDCRGRGIFRKDSTTLLVGDYCSFEPTEPGKGSITKLYPRKNSLYRPPVSNIDRLVLVVSLAEPEPNGLVLDQMTVLASKQDIPVCFIFTKPDLADSLPWVSIYQKAGFPTFVVNNLTGEGIEDVRDLTRSGISVFTGNSGAGKSSLCNALFPRLSLPTAAISQKLGRGKHTTRHVELYENGLGGFIADTPGFSSVELADNEQILAQDLQYCFQEFLPHLTSCRFTGCSHRGEKGCAICSKVSEGIIPFERHENYCRLYESVKDLKAWQI